MIFVFPKALARLGSSELVSEITQPRLRLR